ncbi:MAG: AlkA N-terminal domain-containing protein [Anaerovoracaceae bacterium]
MKLNDDVLYEAFKARDARFDGRIFVGVSSTGIYCRPVCKAKHAKRENCTFFPSAAAAEKAGYRPCLLCRPELAPGYSITDASSALAKKAVRLIEESCGTGESLRKIAEKLGCTPRHLRRVFMEEYKVTPIQYMQTCRLLLAKNLLTDTDLSVLDVAMAAGFGSLRRLNDLFHEQYHLTPTALRRNAAKGKAPQGEITVNIGYRPPYRWNEILEFFAQRAISGVEKVAAGAYMRTVHLTDRNGKIHRGWIRVSDDQKKNALSVTLSDTLVPVLSQVLTRVKRLFDMYCEPDVVYETVRTLNDVKPGAYVPGLRIPGCFDSLETAVRAILGQQITVKAANVLAARIAAAFGKPLETGIEGLQLTFPSIKDFISLEDPEEELGRLGVIAARSRCITELAKKLYTGDIELDDCVDPETEIQKLMRIKGIGKWTANYIAMRTMGWPDAFLETDSGIRHALPDLKPEEMAAMSEKWKPWRSYVTMGLWNSL